MEMSFIVPPRFEGGCLRDFLRASGVSATLIKAVKNETGGFWVEDGPARTCDTVHLSLIHISEPTRQIK